MNAPLTTIDVVRRDYRHAITGAKLPGSTDLCDILGYSKDALLAAAHHLAINGLHYRTEWDEKADTGTLAHDLVRQKIEGAALTTAPEGTPLEREMRARRSLRAALTTAPEGTPLEREMRARRSLQAFEEWRAFRDFVPYSVERPLVSSLLGYGATHDVIGRLDHRTTLIDWKTGKVHPEHIVQMQFNRALWELNDPRLIERALLVQLPTDGSPAREYEIPREMLDRAAPVCAALLVIHNVFPTLKLPKGK